MHRFEIAEFIDTALPGLANGGAFERGGKDPLIQFGLKARADPGQETPAGEIQNPHHRVEERHQNREGEQRFFRPAAKHTVVNLQHKYGPGEHQRIHKHAEQPNGPEQSTALAACGDQFRLACFAFPIPHLWRPPI